MSQEQLSELYTISQSKFYIRMIISGILLSYMNLNLQEEEILSGEVSALSPRLRQGASLLIITALIFFFCLSESTLGNDDSEENRKNFAASLFTLTAALLRFPRTSCD